MLQLHLEASICLREGKAAEAAALLAQAEEQRVKVTGTCDGKPFDDMRDLDDLTASFFEVLATNGNYYWVPIERLECLEFQEPKLPRDLLWRRAHMIVANGPDGEVYLPTLYAGTAGGGRRPGATRAVSPTGGGDGRSVRGVGLRTFLVGGEARPIMELKETFDRPPSGG